MNERKHENTGTHLRYLHVDFEIQMHNLSIMKSTSRILPYW